jgi:hypothetical protein
MSDHEQHFLDMAELAAAGQSTAPQLASDDQRTESPAATHESKHFILKLKDDPQVQIRASRKRAFTNGLEASYNFPWELREVEPPAGKTPEQLEKGDKVTFIAGTGSVIAATVFKIHKQQRGKRPTVTLHTVWSNDQVEPADTEPSQSSSKRPKHKAESAEVGSEPESKALRAEVPNNVVFAIYFSLDDFLEDEPLLPEISARMKGITGHFAHLMSADFAHLMSAGMPDGPYILALLDPSMGAYLQKLFMADPAAASPAMRGFHLITSAFSPKEPIDLGKVKDFLRSKLSLTGESFTVMLAYDNASVVNETLPDMAFGFNRRALECAAARAQSPDPSDSESNSGFTGYIDLRGSDSDDE